MFVRRKVITVKRCLSGDLYSQKGKLLAAYDGQPGGTQMTVQYARQMGIQVCYIKPAVQQK